ncbi:helix-turn-helix domain-containing protein [Sphingoaurantiacus capsulatus]|uniref:Helix-turn-helix domain-containing protein n=1 Tax=Sphingoaurantiacus capsulatus TaxID=1771310 RepID=A0ABV7XB59_9SPHN
MRDLQYVTGADGTRIAVVVPIAEYESLVSLGEAAEARLDAADAAAVPALTAQAEAEGTIPAEVVDLMLDEGLSAVKAWRTYRKLTTVALAQEARLSPAFVNKIERGLVYGTRETRRKLASALGAPVAALDDYNLG